MKIEQIKAFIQSRLDSIQRFPPSKEEHTRLVAYSLGQTDADWVAREEELKAILDFINAADQPRVVDHPFAEGYFA